MNTVYAVANGLAGNDTVGMRGEYFGAMAYIIAKIQQVDPRIRIVIGNYFSQDYGSALTGFVFRLADELSHGAHGAVDAPAAGLEKYHGEKAQKRGSEHDAVKAEGKLRNARMQERSVIGPVPWQFKYPKNGQTFMQHPQATQSDEFTNALRFFLVIIVSS